MAINRKSRVGETYWHRGAPRKPISARKIKHVANLLTQLCEESGVGMITGAKNTILIQLTDIMPLLRYISQWYSPPHTLMGFDRIALVTWLAGLEGELEIYAAGNRPRSRAGYVRRLEVEIHRIANLDQPARTIAATELMRRIKEARRVVQAAEKYLREDYGDLWASRYAGGEWWWRDLEKLAGLASPENTD